MKIAFYLLREFDELPMVEELSHEYGYEYVWTSDVPNEETLKMAEGCDAISITPCVLTDEYLETLNSYGVKYIMTRSIGYDHIPNEKAKSLGMRMSNATYPPECVSNYAIMLMLMATRNMKQILQRADVQDYSLKGKMGKEIGELTVGVMGTGNIGRTLIRHLSTFGCKILAYDIYENEEVKQFAKYVSLDELYAQSDVITLHMPANDENYHIINDDSISKMKDGVIIVNTARGALIDSYALMRGLDSKKIDGAALDVIENEQGLYYFNHVGSPIPNEELNLLRSYPNVIMSPHTAFYTRTTVWNMVKKQFASLKAFTEGSDNPYEIFK